MRMMQNKKMIQKFFAGSAFFFVSFAFYSVVSAYTLLEPLPGLGKEVPESGGLATYLSWLFKFMLAAAAFLAVIQIVIGGIQMIIGGASESQRTGAKARIWDAVWGLLLALASWLILWTINPSLTEMKLIIPEIKWSLSGGETKTPSTTGKVARGQWAALPKCKPAANGFCSVSALQKTFGDQAKNAAAVCNCESSGNAGAVGKIKTSSGYPKGLFQITSGTARDFGCSYDFLDQPKHNMECAKKIYDKNGWSGNRWECATGCAI